MTRVIESDLSVHIELLLDSKMIDYIVVWSVLEKILKQLDIRFFALSLCHSFITDVSINITKYEEYILFSFDVER